MEFDDVFEKINDYKVELLDTEYKINTSYFGNIKNLDTNKCISIAGKSPDWYKGQEMKILAPKYDVFMNYKKNRDELEYKKGFYLKTIKSLNVLEIIKKLDGKIILCYEKPGEFCHRHLIISWLKRIGVKLKSKEL